jgi:uncharacterized protein YggU (UPF0235/DUF167 family)
VRLTVDVKPASHRPGITRTGGGVVVAVRARAIDGRANAAVIAAVAAWLGLPPSRVTIERGVQGRTKRLAVEGLDERAYAQALERL